MKQDSSSGYQALNQGTALVDPVWAGRLLLTGVDRRSYLQGLLTNDIEALKPGTGCYAAMLTAQGRMLADMRVLELGDAVLLTLPAGVAPAIREHLERFVFAEDVQVQDVSSVRATIGVYGPDAADTLARAGLNGTVPAELYSSARARIAGADALLVSGDEAGPGFDLFVDRDATVTVREALLQAGAVPASEADVETVRIERGRPRFGVDMDADTIPLEAGIEDIAISRTKGCYVGQEVIVRVLDRGHGRVARRLVGLTFDADAKAPASGAHIVSGNRDIGHLTSAVWSPRLARPIGLGYVHRDFVAPGTPVAVDGVRAVVSDGTEHPKLPG